MNGITHLARRVQALSREVADLKAARLNRIKKAGGGGGIPPHPFKIVKSGDSLIKLHHGTVNGNTPTIDSDPLTVEFSDEDNPTIELTGTETHTISLKVTLNGSFQPTTFEIDSATSAPTDTTSIGYYTLGTVTTEDDVITGIHQYWLTNATYFYAGDDEHIFFL